MSRQTALRYRHESSDVAASTRPVTPLAQSPWTAPRATSSTFYRTARASLALGLKSSSRTAFHFG